MYWQISKLREHIIGEESDLPVFLVSLAFGAASVGMWLISLPLIDPAKMTDWGLISVLPWTFYVSIALLAISFILLLRQSRVNEGLLLLHIVGLIFFIHGTPQIVYGTLRYSWAWKHIGVIDFIQRHGELDPNILFMGIYHNWPGFFAVNALITELAGFQSALAYAGWAPVFFNILDMGALVVIFRALTRDPRRVWLSVWLFFLTSWIGQDYFSPQALTYFLFLLAIGLVLYWLRNPAVSLAQTLKSWPLVGRLSAHLQKRLPAETMPGTGEARPDRSTLMAITLIIILFMYVIVSSHQLTPLMAFAALAALALFGVARTRSLAILIITLLAAWVVYVATPFLQHNISDLFNSTGLLVKNFNDNFTNLSVASPAQVVIAWMDRLLSAGIWLLALIGVVQSWRRGKLDLAPILLALAPLPVIATSNYGGEMVFRVYYFGLPFIAYLASGVFAGEEIRLPNWRTSILVLTVSALLFAGFLFAYYGKERQYYFPPDEVTGAEYLLQTAPRGSVIVNLTSDYPINYRDYEFYNYMTIGALDPHDQLKVINDPVRMVTSFMEKIPPANQMYLRSQRIYIPSAQEAAKGGFAFGSYPAGYVVIAYSQRANIEMTGLLPPGAPDKILLSLLTSGKFNIIFQSENMVILKYLGSPVQGKP